MNVKKAGEKYRCNICGNEVTVTKAGGGELVCCGQPMEIMEGRPAANAGDAKPKKNFTENEAKEIGEKLGIKWDKFNTDQFRRGMDVELEHGFRDLSTNVTDSDSLVTGKIALAHLNEFPDYYDRLEKMEEEAEKFWENK